MNGAELYWTTWLLFLVQITTSPITTNFTTTHQEMDPESVPEHFITSILVSQQSINTVTSTCAVHEMFLFLLKQPQIGWRCIVCRPPTQRTFAEITGNYFERKFKLHLGMSRSAFAILLHVLRPEISDYENNEDGYVKEMDRRRTGKSSQASTKFAILLRIVQGGSFKNVATSFDVGGTLVYIIVYHGRHWFWKNWSLKSFRHFIKSCEKLHKDLRHHGRR